MGRSRKKKTFPTPNKITLRMLILGSQKCFTCQIFVIFTQSSSSNPNYFCSAVFGINKEKNTQLCFRKNGIDRLAQAICLQNSLLLYDYCLRILLIFLTVIDIVFCSKLTASQRQYIVQYITYNHL